jgi:transmembrane sensor
MQPAELQQLLERYLEGNISKDDFKLLWDTIRANPDEQVLSNAIESVITGKKITGLSDPAEAANALTKVKTAMAADRQIQEHSKDNIRILDGRLLRYAAAIVVIAGAGIYVWSSQPKKDQATTIVQLTKTADVQPGSSKALLTLADGTTIVLDNAANGKIAEQGPVQVVKLANGQLQYRTANKDISKSTEKINTMSTPRGGQYQLTLPDGSQVWLNAESSITYPVFFAGSERKVKITGEVYFEVAKDKTKPFRVLAGNQHVEVLGTHFNVNAYGDDGNIKTSLLEGSVKIEGRLLKPGQAYSNGEVVATDVNQDVAWKNGVFNFNDQTLAQVMRQLSRWYNIDVAYPVGVPRKEYGGEMGRNLSLAQVLKGLENSGIHFQLEGRRLFVKP